MADTTRPGPVAYLITVLLMAAGGYWLWAHFTGNPGRLQSYAVQRDVWGSYSATVTNDTDGRLADVSCQVTAKGPGGKELGLDTFTIAHLAKGETRYHDGKVALLSAGSREFADSYSIACA